MPRLPGRRAVPWALALELAVTARDHWGKLTPGERAHLQSLARKFKGRPANLTPRDRKDLRRMLAKMDLPGMGRSLLPRVRRPRGR